MLKNIESDESKSKRKDSFGNVCREDLMIDIAKSESDNAETLEACPSTANILRKIGKLKKPPKQ